MCSQVEVGACELAQVSDLPVQRGVGHTDVIPQLLHVQLTNSTPQAQAQAGSAQGTIVGCIGGRDGV